MVSATNNRKRIDATPPRFLDDRGSGDYSANRNMYASDFVSLIMDDKEKETEKRCDRMSSFM